MDQRSRWMQRCEARARAGVLRRTEWRAAKGGVSIVESKGFARCSGLQEFEAAPKAAGKAKANKAKAKAAAKELEDLKRQAPDKRACEWACKGVVLPISLGHEKLTERY
mmetsp:Transcript_25465/g.47869  ORF Transcript_25465/g.47869 Transcript_25465/m.47869 type:complete len:109 (+) Transcript_25465:73-399(+)